MARFLTIGIPSMAVFNGHSIAGGVFLGLSHDRVIMNASNPKWKICLSEFTFSGYAPYPYIKFINTLFSGRIAKTMFLATEIKS